MFNGSFDAELKLCLCGAVELFVDRNIAWIENNEGTSTVGVTFKDDFGTGWNG